MRLVALGALAFGYERFRPPTMPSLVETFQNLTGSTSGPPTAPRAPAGPPQATDDTTGFDRAALDAYNERRAVVNRIATTVDEWIADYMQTQCRLDAEAAAEATEANRAKWGMRAHVPVGPADHGPKEFRLTGDAVNELYFRLTDMPEFMVERNQELIALVNADWELFLREIRRNMTGTEAHSYTVPYFCSDADDFGDKWPWGAKMTLRKLRDQTVANYRGLLK